MASATAIHRCRFVDDFPGEVTCVAACDQLDIISVGRKGGTIELWRTTGTAVHYVDSIQSSAISSIRALRWSSNKRPRLYGASLEGQLFEVDLRRGAIQNITDSCGGAVWDIAVCPANKWLAAACDDGSVRVFKIDDGAIEYATACLATEGRMLCVAWHPTEMALYSGTAKARILGWDLRAVLSSTSSTGRTARAAMRITLERLVKDQVSVWALRVLEDFTVLSVDSVGCLSIWDGRTGTRLSSFSVSEADLTALETVEVDNRPAGGLLERWAVAGSLDGRVFSFRCVGAHAGAGSTTGAAASIAVPGATAARWVVAGSHAAHSHDVQSITVHKRQVLSAGVDGALCMVPLAQIGRKTPKKFVSASNTTHVIPHQRLLIAAHAESVKIWRMAAEDVVEADKATVASNDKGGAPRQRVPEDPTFLLQFDYTESGRLIDAVMEASGQYFVLQSTNGAFLYQLTWSEPTDGSARAITAVTQQDWPGRIRSHTIRKVVASAYASHFLVNATDGAAWIINPTATPAEVVPFLCAAEGSATAETATTSSSSTSSSDDEGESSSDTSSGESDGEVSSGSSVSSVSAAVPAAASAAQKRKRGAAEDTAGSHRHSPLYIRSAVFSPSGAIACQSTTGQLWVAAAGSSAGVSRGILLRQHYDVLTMQFVTRAVPEGHATGKGKAADATEPRDNLMVVLPNHDVLYFDARTRRVTPRGGDDVQVALRAMADASEPIIGSTSSTAGVVLFSRSSMLRVNPPGAPTTSNIQQPKKALKKLRVHRYEPIRAACYLNAAGSELVVLEVPLLRALQHLPAQVQRSTYGQ